MKLSVVIAGADAPPSAFVVWRGWERSIAKAAEYGYQGVELALREAGEVDPHALSRALSKAGLSVSAISTGQVFATLGLYFTHPEEAARRRAVAVFQGLIDLAADFTQVINVGRSRGFVAEGQSRAEAETLFLDTAGTITAYARQKNVTLVIEPVNRYEINFINNLDEGAALMDKLPYPNKGLMPDLFHMNIEDDRIGASLRRAGARVRYVHLADSNRLAPGKGHIDFDEALKALADIGFDGWAAVEILPKPDPDTAARDAATFLLPKLAAYRPRREAQV
ncbi:MAG TPA: sugar phosphate isomerase/epimerase family protein [Clostridia bacterium]|nr:sugar phosphate isomerase/epimerase family protein [Clostridia bacterium]